MGGEEAWDFLVRHAGATTDSRGVPVIVVSAMPDREKGLALGADAYLSKPIDRRMLLDTLTGLSDRARIRRLESSR